MKRMIRAGAVVSATLLASNDAALQVGDVAPGFTAPSTAGDIELGSALQQGPVILALYPADFTSG